MASKQRADKQKEKEKKEKIILVALVAVLVIVGAIELPSLLKKSGSPSSSGGSAAQTTSASSGTSAGATPTSTSAAIGSLPNSSGYKAKAGQLSEFSLFNSRDPFGNATTASTELPTTSSATTTDSKTNSTTTITTPRSRYVAARISVNGASEDVALNATFPSASPVFVLDSVTAKKIKISVAGGSFSSGGSEVTIGKGKSVTLVNTVDSTRYVIKFVAAIKGTAPAGGTTTNTTPAGGTTGTTG